MEDFLQFEALLTDEQRMIQTTVRRFVDEEVIPKIGDCYEAAKFPRAWIDRCAELGLLGLTLPASASGAEADYLSYGLVCQELERGDSGLRSFVSVQNSLCMYPIFRYGSQAQQQQYLPRLAKAEWIACFGLTEPDAGSDPASMRTQAQAVDGGWLLNGSKQWITNAPIADLAIVWAKTSEGVRGFLVEATSPGFSATTISQKMSLRASITGGLQFNDCFVPDSQLLPGSSKGLGAPLSCLSQARYGIAWGALGAASHCYDLALAYAKERQQFAKPVASFQLVQAAFADMLTALTKGQCLNHRLATLQDAGKARPEMISMAKRNACRDALAIARECRNLLGGNGISLEYHVIRHMMNLESVFTYEGTDNIHTLILGKYATDINAFA